MKDDSLTSEEKLLRLIRKKDKPAVAMPEGQLAASADLPEEAQGSAKQMDVLALSIRILAVTACIILAFALSKYARTPPLATQVPFFSTQTSEGNSPTQKKKEDGLSIAAVEVPPFDFYKPVIESRDIFQAPWEKPASATPVAGASASGSELVKQLKLVGILLDKDPKAIVEDLGTQQTFFVSPGERIGNAVVDEIRQDKVILIFGQEKVELVP